MMKKRIYGEKTVVELTKKVSKTEIVNDLEIDDKKRPASSYLTYRLNEKIKSIANNVQTNEEEIIKVNGKLDDCKKELKTDISNLDSKYQNETERIDEKLDESISVLFDNTIGLKFIVDKRYDYILNRFRNIDETIVKKEKDIYEEINKDIDDLIKTIKDKEKIINERINTLYKKLNNKVDDSTSTLFDDVIALNFLINEKFNFIDKRINELKNKINSFIIEVKDDISNIKVLISDLDKRVKKLEEK